MTTKSMEAQIAARGVLGNFPRFGKLRKGAPKTEKGAGRDQDHFRLTLETPYEHIRPAFEQLFGTEPDVFHNVLLAADSPDQAFQYWKEEWAHARLLRRCDEETIIVHWDGNKPGYDTTPAACTCNPLNRDCKDHGRMDIVIPALFELTGEWGKFTVETTSIYDVAALRSYMKMAESFMQKLPNLAFWSVPFTNGRAISTLNVTINGKRSLKPMSLLYAKIEPEFNQQIFTPMLTRPAQLLLAGGDLGAVESIEEGMRDIEFEAEFTQAASWDREYVKQQTVHLFDHDNHWDNAIAGMIASEELLDEMTDQDAIEAIIINREQRKVEKETQNSGKNGSKSRKKGSNLSAAQPPAQSSAVGAEWLQNAQRLNNFIARAHSDLKLNIANIIEALKNASDPAELENIQEFLGSDLQAWAACIAYKVMYDPERLTEFAPVGSSVWTAAVQIIERYQQRLADIPF